MISRRKLFAWLGIAPVAVVSTAPPVSVDYLSLLKNVLSVAFAPTTPQQEREREHKAYIKAWMHVISSLQKMSEDNQANEIRSILYWIGKTARYVGPDQDSRADRWELITDLKSDWQPWAWPYDSHHVRDHERKRYILIIKDEKERIDGSTSATFGPWRRENEQIHASHTDVVNKVG